MGGDSRRVIVFRKLFSDQPVLRGMVKGRHWNMLRPWRGFFLGLRDGLGKFLLRSYDQIFILANRFLLGSFFTVLLAWSVNSDFWAGAILAPNGPLFWKILYMALVPGLLATGLFYFGLSNVEASIASILELIFPLSSVLIMWKFFGQTLDRVQIGAAFILFYSMSRITSPSMKQNSR